MNSMVFLIMTTSTESQIWAASAFFTRISKFAWDIYMTLDKLLTFMKFQYETLSSYPMFHAFRTCHYPVKALY